MRALWMQTIAQDRDLLEAEVRLRTPLGDRWNLVRVTPYRREGKRPAGWLPAGPDRTPRARRRPARGGEAGAERAHDQRDCT